MKKLIAIVMAVALFSTLSIASPANGQTMEELQAQIAALLVQIQQLQNQLTGMGGSTVGLPAACVGVTFNTNLTIGSTGNDVKCLQAMLNQDPATQVAISGVGSTGLETFYFGNLTASAVVKFQNKYASEILAPLGLTAGTGFFGPSTRTKLNAMMVSTPTTPTTPGPGITTPGAEGSLIGTISALPASGIEIYIAQTNKAVAGLDIKATGSDVLVNRFDVNFNVRPWLYINSLTISDGTTSKTVSVTSANTTEVTVGSDYMVRVEGLGILISKDTTKKLTITVDAVTSLPSGTTSQAVIVTLGINAVRGIDGANISQYAPAAALTSVRTFTVKAGDTADLELSANTANPKARNYPVSDSAETAGVELLKVNVKARNNTAVLRTLEALVTGSDTPSSGTITAIYLYDGDTLLSSTSTLTSATSTFSNINLTIPKDVTKTLTIKADLAKTVGNYVGGSTVYVTLEVNSKGLAAEDATTYATATVSGSSVTSGASYLYAKVPTLALSSATISSVSVSTGTIAYNGKADAKITLNITANGGDIYVASSTSNDVMATSSIAASTTVVQSITSSAEVSTYGNYIIRSGETKSFEIFAQLTRVDDGNSSTVGDLATYVYLTNLKWLTSDGGALADYTDQTWALADFKTGNVILEYVR